MIKVVIAEDTPRDVDILRLILEEHCDNIEVAGVGQTVKEAIGIIKRAHPDVLFLDVEMSPYTGFDILNAFPELPFHVIFTTSHEEYSLQAIKLSALDYLVKPLKIEEVQAALSKIKPKGSQNFKELIPFLKSYLHDAEHSTSKIVIPDEDGYKLVELKEILYCEASNSYTKIHLENNKTCLVSKPLREYDRLLTEKGFYRIHKSFVVNISHIIKIIKGDGAAVVISNKEIIPISSRKRNPFFKKLEGVIEM